MVLNQTSLVIVVGGSLGIKDFRPAADPYFSGISRDTEKNGTPFPIPYAPIRNPNSLGIEKPQYMGGP